MAKLISAALTQLAIQDAQSGLITLVGVMTSIGAPQLPIPGAVVRLWSLWEREEESDRILQARAIPMDPTGVRRLDLAETVEMTADTTFHNWLSGFTRWMIDSPGRWTVLLQLLRESDWVDMACLPLDVFQGPVELVVGSGNRGFAPADPQTGSRR